MSVHSIEDDLVLATNTYRELVENKVWYGISGGVHLPCFKYKKDGHATKDCTVKDTNNTTRDSNKDWTRVKPLDGASQTMSKYNKTWFWCNKCNRWNTTHSNDTHVKRDSVPSGFTSTGTAVPAIDDDSTIDDDGAPVHHQAHFTHLILNGLQRF